MLSNTCKYGIRAVIYLAINGGEDKRIGIKQISSDLNIPSPFLGKILQSLAKQKLLASTKGPHGGFGLGRNASNIKLMDVVEIIDGLDVFRTCLLGMEICKEDIKKQDICPVHKTSEPLRQSLHHMFKNTSVGDVAQGLAEIDEKYFL